MTSWCRLAGAVFLIASTSACSAPRGVHLAATTKPFTMKVTGGGPLYSLGVSGPFADDAAMRAYLAATKMAPIWSIAPIDPKATASSLPPIEYGVASKAFREDKGPAPALEIGKLYLVHAVLTTDGSPLSWGQNTTGSYSLCVAVQPTQLAEVPCPGR